MDQSKAIYQTRHASSLLIVVFFAINVSTAVTVHTESAFRFQIPKGWIDLTRGVPEAYSSILPKDVLDYIRQGKWAACAWDFEGRSGDYVATMNATVSSVRFTINQRFLDDAAIDQVRTLGPNAEVQEKQIVRIGSADAGLLVARASVSNHPVVAMAYFIPGRNESAVLIYTASLDSLGRYRPVFEAAAATLGSRFSGRDNGASGSNFRGDNP